MLEIHNRIFHSLLDRGEGLSLASVTCHRCEFMNCGLSLTKDIRRRSTISDVLLENCSVSASDIGPAVFRRVRIDGLATGDLLIVWGAVFDQVTLLGQIGKIKINRHVHHVDQSSAVQSPFDDFRLEFYRKVEWALDISSARFRLLELSGIPARLIRRNPSSQMVITRERAKQNDWRSRLSPGNHHWPFAIDMFLARGDEDQVLIAPTIGPKKQVTKLLRDLEELRDLGVVTA